MGNGRHLKLWRMGRILGRDGDGSDSCEYVVEGENSSGMKKNTRLGGHGKCCCDEFILFLFV